MTSLRFRLLLGTALGTTAVLLASGVVLYTLVGRTLRAEFDESLAARARSLCALAEQDEDGLEFELDEVSLPEFEPSNRAEYYQIWLSDGAVFSRSPSLLDAHFERVVLTPGAPAFQTVALPDGRPGRVVQIAFVPRQEHGHANPPMTPTLALGRGVDGLLATLARVRWVLAAVCLAAVASSAGVLSWVVRRSVKPIEDLGRRIADVGEGDLSARIEAAGTPTELSPVVHRLNELLERLEAAFQRERRFTGDVAHELRTPLSGLRSKLEVALSRDRDPEAYRKALGDCLAIDLQMQRMVENLLHLARADAGQLEIRREPVDLPELVRECWKPLEQRASARGLRVDWRLETGAPTATDREKLQLVIQNILDNAVTHAAGEGQIALAVSGEDGAITLTVGNTSNGFPPDEVPRVFDRFWRAGSSSGEADEAHCGLGLPLCKAVIEQLDGSIDATATADGTFKVTVRLPRRDDLPA